jgi:hypothetical protein
MMNTESLYFSFDDYANSLVELIREQNREDSFVIAITGTWGCGKTTLMNSTLDKLNDDTFIKTVFNAWRYTKEDAVWRGFFINILSALREHILNKEVTHKIGWEQHDLNLCEKLLDETERSLYTAFTKEVPGEVSIDARNVAKSGLKLALRFVPWGEFASDWISRIFQERNEEGKPVTETFSEKDIDELWGVFKRSVVKRQIEKITSMEQFRFSMEKLLNAVLCGDYEEPIRKEKLKAIPESFQLVVAIDDLDRCLPEQALEIFEAIKLFIDLPRTNFLVALDQDIIQHALNLRYKQEKLIRPQIRAEQYIEKMIDLSFSVPSVLEPNFIKYIENELPNGKQLISIYETLKIALPINLRTWQRFATKADFGKNIIKRIHKAGKENLSLIFENPEITNMYFKLQCLAYQWPEVFRKIGNIDVYFELERCSIESSFEKYQNKTDENLATFVTKSSSNSHKVPDSVWKTIKDTELIRFLKSKPLFKDIENKHVLQIVFSLDHEE